MKRDKTVPISLFVFVGALGVKMALGIPDAVRADDPVAYRIPNVLMALAAFRAAVLWFQTLSHAVKHAPPDNRMAWVLTHILLGPIAAYRYYFLYFMARPDYKHRAT